MQSARDGSTDDLLYSRLPQMFAYRQCSSVTYWRRFRCL